jgi:hypothetical protein
MVEFEFDVDTKPELDLPESYADTFSVPRNVSSSSTSSAAVLSAASSPPRLLLFEVGFE